MNAHRLPFAGTTLDLLPERALWWADGRLLCVSDLHLGKSERMARRGGALLPPYETEATLDRLEALVAALDPATVVSLGDSFDDDAAQAALPEAARLRIATLQAGRDWVWIEGNHDPGPVSIGGRHMAELRAGPLTFRHIADRSGAQGEISGHYHPKARLPGGGGSRPAFLADARRVILPAFGAYTGGLDAGDRAFDGLFDARAVAVLCGRKAMPAPLSACTTRRMAQPPQGWRPR